MAHRAAPRAWAAAVGLFIGPCTAAAAAASPLGTSAARAPRALRTSAVAGAPGAAVEEQPPRAAIDEKAQVLIVGASRGLGVEFVSQCLRKGATVYATHRGTSAPDALVAAASWQDAESRLHALCMDVTDSASIASAATEIRRIAGSKRPLTHVIHNAGVYGPRQGLQSLTKEALLTTFETNALGPLLVAQAVVPLLAPPPRGVVASPRLPVYATMSSKMGSVEDNTSGGAYGYRMSKSALTMATKSLWHDLRGTAAVVCLHPGYVRTDMTGGSGLINADESVKGMLRAVEATDGNQPFRWVDYKACLIPF